MRTNDFSAFDGMSTETLLEILRLDSFMPEGKGCGTDAALYILQVIAEREAERPPVHDD